MTIIQNKNEKNTQEYVIPLRDVKTTLASKSTQQKTDARGKWQDSLACVNR